MRNFRIWPHPAVAVSLTQPVKTEICSSEEDCRVTAFSFTVLNADNMGFDCGVHIEALFRKHEARNKEYRLIFVVSKEREHSSYIATAMAAMAVTIPNLPPISDVQSYLLRHLKVGKGNSAARHDPDRSRFRLVTSRQAGNGKSLLCRRVKEKNKSVSGGTSSTLQIQGWIH